MDKNYKNKKRITIILLSVLTVCLVSCLIWYVRTMGKAELPVVLPAVNSETEVLVTVPEIDTAGIVELEKETELQQGTETEQAEAQLETEEASTEENRGEEIAAAPSGAQPTRTDGKPQTPKDAVPPSELPAEATSIVAVENPDDDGNCQPEHTKPQENQPQGGDTNPAGAVYVPGFGYIENSGSNEQRTSYTDGDWNKQIGTMQ